MGAGTGVRRKTRVVRQRAKGPIDPRLGTRIRELRTAKGLSQGDLAGDDFTKGFISLLETGRTRMSLRAAEIVAQRLGVKVVDLIATSDTGSTELELMLLRGEQQLSAGRHDLALQLVDMVAAQGVGSLRARALRVRGRALIEMRKPRDGLAVLEEATRSAESLNLRELATRILYDRAVAHAHLDEPGNALALALECEAAMKAGGLVDRTLELQLRSLLATIFVRAGDIDSADLQGRRALDLAEDVVDTEALATLYSTLSYARQNQRDLDAALGYARQSLSLFEGLGRERAVGQLWHNLAKIHLERGDFNKALDAADRGDAVATRATIPALAAGLLSLRAEIAARQRRWADARELATAATTHPAASPVTRGRAYLVQARAMAAKHGTAAAIKPLLKSAEDALRGEPPRVRAEAQETAAAVLAERGDWRAAYEKANEALQLHRPTLQPTQARHYPPRSSARAGG
jgi:transcriptional regulator with XRE-family HTH domain